jgi:hypothetical protein
LQQQSCLISPNLRRGTNGYRDLIVSGLPLVWNTKVGVTQVNSLIYSMGPEADDIFASFELNDENKKKYPKVKEKFSL